MALTTEQLLSVLGVAGILLAMLFVNTYMSRRTASPAADSPGQDGDLLCKFVTHDGSVVGETVAFEGGRALLKQAGVYKAVDRAALRPDGADLRLSGEVDWDAAEREGEAWFERIKGSGSEGITEQLTTSADVKAPALAAVGSRGEEE